MAQEGEKKAPAAAEVQEKRDSPFTLALIAGAFAGTGVDVSLHPLDTMRTRLQSQEGFWKAGGFRGCYRGIFSAALGSGPGAAAFFSTYETMKQVIKQNSNGQEHWTHHAVASSCGEVGACLVRVPTAVITQNMQVGRYNSFAEAVSTTLKTGGLGGFYVGYGTTVMREIPFAFIQFPVYEGLKKAWASVQQADTSPNQGAVCGSIAGAVASGITTPLDVAKTRIMLEKPVEGQPKVYTGTIQTLQKISAEEGALALFTGIVPRVGWITVGGFIFFGVYEWSTELLWNTGAWGSKY
jgi:solute carrier family 25 S-adenosylmethionine transporter 26